MSEVLATIRRHAESHRALAGSDAYSAQEAPRLEETLIAVAKLIEASEELLKSQSGPWERGSAYISARGAENMNAAMKKTRAALAAVRGGAA